MRLWLQSRHRDCVGPSEPWWSEIFQLSITTDCHPPWQEDVLGTHRVWVEESERRGPKTWLGELLTLPFPVWPWASHLASLRYFLFSST